MICEFQDYIDGKTSIFDTRQVEYESIWDQLQLSTTEREAADRIIDLYHTQEKYVEEVVIFTAYSCMKPLQREHARHQADHYIPLEQLKVTSRNPTLVDTLIQSGILQRHHKWNKFFQEPKEVEGFVVMAYSHEKKHPQVPYKLNPNVIRKMEEGEPIF